MTSDFSAGNYRFIPAVFQYSGGVAANPGYEIERVRFDQWVPLAEGFAQIAKYIQAAGRPLTSFVTIPCRKRGASGPRTNKRPRCVRSPLAITSSGLISSTRWPSASIDSGRSPRPKWRSERWRRRVGTAV